MLTLRDIIYGLKIRPKVEDQFLKTRSIFMSWDNQDLAAK